jgi:hypothetical protein
MIEISTNINKAGIISNSHEKDDLSLTLDNRIGAVGTVEREGTLEETAHFGNHSNRMDKSCRTTLCHTHLVGNQFVHVP